VGQSDIEEPVEHGCRRDVARVEAELNQYFLDPQVLRRGREDAVEYGARIQITGAVHVCLTKSAGTPENREIMPPLMPF
jgi:hypothetical protein